MRILYKLTFLLCLLLGSGFAQVQVEAQDSLIHIPQDELSPQSPPPKEYPSIQLSNQVPTKSEKSLSLKRKIAIGMLIPFTMFTGYGVYEGYNVDVASDDYQDAQNQQDIKQSLEAKNDIEESRRNRNISIGASLGTFAVATLLWFLPE